MCEGAVVPPEAGMADAGMAKQSESDLARAPPKPISDAINR